MPTPNPTTIAQHLADLKQRIDSLRTHFYHIESEFSRAFQSLEKRPSHDGFAELGLLRQLLWRYVQRRSEPEFLEGLIAQFDSLGELDLGTTRLAPLNSLLAEMSRLQNEEPMDDCFVTWQRTSKAFLSYMESESKFVSQGLRMLNPTMEPDRASNSPPLPKANRS